jgi:DNA invertase Pin-like site-specific DNA recombinase
MLIGYARTSTADQEAGFEAQQRDLAASGCEKIFSERTSAVATRPELERALDYIRDTDTLVVTRLDRLARSTAHALELETRIAAKGARLRILDISVDTATASGRLTFTMLAAVAEFERRLLLERQLEGIAAAKAAGKYKGRAPTARRKTAEIRELVAAGVEKAEVARRLGMAGRAFIGVWRADGGANSQDHSPSRPR